MKKIEKYKQEIRQNIKWKVENPTKLGGQQCGTPLRPVILESEELNIEIKIGYYRSNYQNKELALTLFDLTLDDLIK